MKLTYLVTGLVLGSIPFTVSAQDMATTWADILRSHGSPTDAYSESFALCSSSDALRGALTASDENGTIRVSRGPESGSSRWEEVALPTTGSDYNIRVSGIFCDQRSGRAVLVESYGGSSMLLDISAVAVGEVLGFLKLRASDRTPLSDVRVVEGGPDDRWRLELDAPSVDEPMLIPGMAAQYRREEDGALIQGRVGEIMTSAEGVGVTCRVVHDQVSEGATRVPMYPLTMLHALFVRHNDEWVEVDIPKALDAMSPACRVP